MCLVSINNHGVIINAAKKNKQEKPHYGRKYWLKRNAIPLAGLALQALSMYFERIK